MKIAVTYEKGSIFQHFGHTQQFKFYDIEGKEIIKEQIISPTGGGHGALAGFLTENINLRRNRRRRADGAG